MTCSSIGPKEWKKGMEGERKKKDPVFEKKENVTLAQRIKILNSQEQKKPDLDCKAF